MLNAPNLVPRDNELVQRGIQEIRDTLEAFKAAVGPREVSGLRAGAMGGRMTLFERALNARCSGAVNDLDPTNLGPRLDRSQGANLDVLV
jgi:hypothetical protein